MTILSVFARHKHCVAKELAIGFSTDRNSEVGLIRQIQNISGATGFVCDPLLDPVVATLHTMLTFADSKLAVEKLFSCMKTAGP
jgi:hypothetical protein